MKPVKDCVIIFMSSYFTIKTLSNLTVMPLINNNKDKDRLTKESKDHYNEVNRNRRIKGTISMLLSIFIGILAYFRIGKKLPKNLLFYSLISLMIFMSMTLLYEVMWQNKFIFEEKNVKKLEEDGMTVEEQKDIVAYSNIYKRHRFANNIVEVVSIGLSILLTILYSTLNKSYFV